jgi:hypothetical protein
VYPEGYDIEWRKNMEYEEGKRPGTLCWTVEDSPGQYSYYEAVPRPGKFAFHEPQRDRPFRREETTVIMSKNGWTMTRIEHAGEVRLNLNEDEAYMASNISGDQGDIEMAELTRQLAEW